MIALNHFFDLLPPERLEQLACFYELDAHHSVRLSGPSVFLCLLTGLLNHKELTLRLLEETYLQQTGQHVDHSSFGKCLARLNPAYFAQIFAWLHQTLAATGKRAPLQALRLRFVDATIVTLSAKLLAFGLKSGHSKQQAGHRQIKSIVELDADGLPNLLHLCREQSECADSVALGQTMRRHTQAGDLWILDKGCHGRERLLALAQAGSFWLTPHSQQALRVERQLWQADPGAWPCAPPQKGEPPFVLVSVQQAVFQNSQPDPKWEAMPLVVIQGCRYNARQKSWQPLVLLTNLPLSEDGSHAGPYTFLELAELYRQRWNIEVFFKFVKQHLSYSHLLSRTENGIRVMLHMSLIAALLLLWYQQQTHLDRGWRSVKFWLAEDVRRWTQEVLQTNAFLPDG